MLMEQLSRNLLRQTTHTVSCGYDAHELFFIITEIAAQSSEK